VDLRSRWLFLLPLLLGATDVERCTGTSGNPIYTEDMCPAVVSGIGGANVAATTSDITITSTRSTGTNTLYWYVSTSATPPSVSDLKDGTSSTKFGSLTADTLEETVGLTGLTASTTYYLHSLHTWESRDSDIHSSTNWTQAAGGGGGGDDLTGTNGVHFACTTASGDNDGSTHANAFETIEAVNANAFALGDDVYFCEGDTHEDKQLIVDWSGSSSDRVIIGCYDPQDSTQANIPVDCQNTGDSWTKPEINGTMDATCLAARNCLFKDPAAVPTDNAHGLIRVTGDNVTIQDWSVQDSAGEGIESSNGVDKFIIQRNTISHTAESGINTGNGAGVAILDNSVKHTSWCDLPTTSYPCKGGAHGAGIGLGISSSDAVVSGNLIESTYGEGIIALFGAGSTAAVIRDNNITDARSACIDVDSKTEVVIEENICWHSSDGELSTNWGFVTRGMLISIEDFGPATTTNVTVRNNIISGTEVCFTYLMDNIVRGTDDDVGALFVGNTCILPTLRAMDLNEAAADVTAEHEVKNNIIYAPTASAEDKCVTKAGAIDYNLWDAAPTDSDCVGANDPTPAKPTLSKDVDTWSFTAASGGPTFADAAMTNGSAGDDVGTPIVTAKHDDTLYTYWSNLTSPYTPADQAVWEKENGYDINGAVRDASTPDMGVDEG